MTSYKELVDAFPPRPIRTIVQLYDTQKLIDSLIDSDELSEDEKDYMEALGLMVKDYEDRMLGFWSMDSGYPGGAE